MSQSVFNIEDDLNAYDYVLPEKLIAQHPVSPRDSSRLLVLHRKTGTWEHRFFRDLPEYLSSDDLIVANNTRVIKARLLGRRVLPQTPAKIGGNVEFVLLEELRPRVWVGLFRASARSVPGLRFEIPIPGSESTLQGTILHGASESPDGTVVAEFDQDPVHSGAGDLPLPHYMNRKGDSQDDQNYQTVFAKTPGSAAAPTAGLHFTDSVMQALRARQVGWEEITLHVGLGTFRPVKKSDIREHVMHEERYEVSPNVAEKVTRWKSGGKRILAVGTTTTRTLESAWQKTGPQGPHLKSGPGRTSLFIRPGHFDFQVADRLLTNFHLPKSTLLILLSTFAGRELVLAAYEEAVRQEYRFFSYGDAMLVL